MKDQISASTDGGCCDNRSLCYNEVRERAYQKWEAAGSPPGDGVQFWLEAEKECSTHGQEEEEEEEMSQTTF